MNLFVKDHKPLFHPWSRRGYNNLTFLTRQTTKEEKPKVAVPPSTLVSQEGKTWVYRLEKDSVREVQVQKGLPLADFVEVLQGLKPGERVVLKPNRHLRDGSKIKIAEK